MLRGSVMTFQSFVTGLIAGLTNLAVISIAVK